MYLTSGELSMIQSKHERNGRIRLGNPKGLVQLEHAIRDKILEAYHVLSLLSFGTA